jgi:hypothetical protein
LKSTEGIVVAIFAGSALSLLTWMSDARSNKVDKRLLQESTSLALDLPISSKTAMVIKKAIDLPGHHCCLKIPPTLTRKLISEAMVILLKFKKK